jgi:hypothetical protein
MLGVLAPTRRRSSLLPEKTMRSAALLLLVAFAAPAYAQSRYAVAWERVVSSTSYDEIGQVALGADGSVYVAGTATAALEEGDGSLGSIFLRKYDGAGTPQWTRKVSRQDEVLDFGTGVTVASDGSVLFAGILGGDTFLARYDDAGVELSSLIDVNVSITRTAKLMPAPTGGSYLYGSTNRFGYGTGHFVKRLAEPGGDLPISLGATLQEALAPAYVEDVAGVVGDADGNTYVLGLTDYGVSQGPVDAYLRKYDPLGGMEWTSYFVMPISGSVTGLAIGPDGNPVAVGAGFDSSDPSGQAGWNAYAWKFNGDGDIVWDREWGGS